MDEVAWWWRCKYDIIGLEVGVEQRADEVRLLSAGEIANWPHRIDKILEREGEGEERG